MPLPLGLQLESREDMRRPCANCGQPVLSSHFFTITIEGQEIRLGPLCEGCLRSGCTLQSEPVAKAGPPAVSQHRRRAVTRQERDRATELGGRKQPGSGSRRGYKSDGRVDGRYRIECKSTVSSRFILAYGDLRKIRSECSGLEVPLFEIEFWERGTLQVKDKWVLVPWDEWRKKARCD